MADVETTLKKILTEKGFKIVSIDVEKNKDISSFIVSINSNNIVFLCIMWGKDFQTHLQF